MTVSIMTLSIISFSTMTLSIMIFCTKTIFIMTVSIMMLNIISFSIMTFSIMAFCIMTICMKTLSSMTVRIVTLFTSTLSITIKMQHSEKWRMSLYYVSSCVSRHPVSYFLLNKQCLYPYKNYDFLKMKIKLQSTLLKKMIDHRQIKKIVCPLTRPVCLVWAD